MNNENANSTRKRAHSLSLNQSEHLPPSVRRRVNVGEVTQAFLPLVVKLKTDSLYSLAAKIILSCSSKDMKDIDLSFFYRDLCRSILFFSGVRRRRPNRKNSKKCVNTRFGKSPKKVVSEILKGGVVTKLPDKRATKEFYSELWRDASRPELTKSDSQVFKPISEEELKRALKGTKQKSSGGLSRVTPGMVRKYCDTHMYDMIVFLNALLRAKRIPSIMKRGKVTLIPKVENAGSNLALYRPITIHCAIYRLFSKILDNRLRSAIGGKISNYQMGLMTGRGTNACARSVVKVKAAMANAWRFQRSISVASLDVKKAFDRVKQKAIIDGLEVLGVERSLIDMCIDGFLNVTRVLTCKRGKVYLSITRGVAQGLALSATLFCVAIDKVSEVMKDAGYNYTRTLNSPVLWREPGSMYFDDVILIDSDVDSLRKRVDRVGTLLGTAGLELNSAKSCFLGCLRARTKRKEFCTITEPLRTSYGELPSCHANGFKYLGIRVKFKRDIPAFNGKLRNELGRVVNSKLSIQNKLVAIKNHVIPRQLYALSLFSPYSFWCTKTRKNKTRIYSDLDRSVKQAIKKVLSIGNHEHSMRLAYVSVKEGGLGVPRFSQIIPGMRSRMFETFVGPERQMVRQWHFNDFDFFQEHEMGLGHEGISQRRTAVVNKNLKEFRELKNGAGNWHVRGLTQVPIVQKRLSGGSFRNAFRLRAGIFPYRGAQMNCRLCGEGVDTMVHILTAKCSSVATDFLKERHNLVVSEVQKFIRRNAKNNSDEPRFQLIREREFKNRAGLRAKPDVVFLDKLKNDIFIFEVQVSYESRRSGIGRIELLSLRAKDKFEKYDLCAELFRESIERDFGLTESKVKIVPIVVGGFGTYKRVSPSTVNMFKHLKLNFEQLIRVCATTAMVKTGNNLAKIFQCFGFEHEQSDVW